MTAIMMNAAKGAQQQRVADLQAFVGELSTDRRALTPDASEFDTVAFAKIQLTNGSASQ